MDAGCQSGSLVVDAAGPDTFTFDELLRLLASAVGARVRLVHTPPPLGFALTRLAGLLLRDVVLSREEVEGLMSGLLTSAEPPTGWPTGSTITMKSLGGGTCTNGGATTGGSRWPRFRPGATMANDPASGLLSGIYRQRSAAGTPSLLQTVTAPVTAPASARSRLVVSMGSLQS